MAWLWMLGDVPQVFRVLVNLLDRKPTPEQLLKLGSIIVDNFASPWTNGPGRPVYWWFVYTKTHGYCFGTFCTFAALVRAISNSDFGRVEILLVPLTMIFRGAVATITAWKSFIWSSNLKYIWTLEFAWVIYIQHMVMTSHKQIVKIVCDNMITNVSGLPGHGMGVDMNAEHGINALKTLFASKGIYSMWDRLGDISACIVQFEVIKRQTCAALGVAHKGSTHYAPNTCHLVWRVADKSCELVLLVFHNDREGNEKIKHRPDLMATGEAKLHSSSLTTFNKKLQGLLAGTLHAGDEYEIDELPPLGLSN